MATNPFAANPFCKSGASVFNDGWNSTAGRPNCEDDFRFNPFCKSGTGISNDAVGGGSKSSEASNAHEGFWPEAGRRGLETTSRGLAQEEEQQSSRQVVGGKCQVSFEKSSATLFRSLLYHSIRDYNLVLKVFYATYHSFTSLLRHFLEVLCISITDYNHFLKVFYVTQSRSYKRCL